MKRIRPPRHLPFLLLALSGFALTAAEEAPKTFRVNDLTFERPGGWSWERPSSQMRKAQLVAPEKRHGHARQRLHQPQRGVEREQDPLRLHGARATPRPVIRARALQEYTAL